MSRRRFLLAAGGLGAWALTSGFNWPFSKNALRESLLIAGSSTMLPAIEFIANAFMRHNPKIDVAFAGGGSTPGLIALQRGSIDIAALSRPLTLTEDTPGTRAYLIGRDAIAIVVHPSNPLRNLTPDQVRTVFNGGVLNWKKLGGINGKIDLFHREEGSTTRNGFEELALDHSDVAETAHGVSTAADMVAAVAAHPNGVGYIALKDMNKDISVLDISGVAMRRETVLSGRYPFLRSFYCVTHGKQREPVRLFLEFVSSAEGQGLLHQMEMIPVR